MGTLDRDKKLLQGSLARLKSLVKSRQGPVATAARTDELAEMMFLLRRDLGETRAARANQ